MLRIADAKRYNARIQAGRELRGHNISQLHDELAGVAEMIEALEKIENGLNSPEWDFVTDELIPARRNLIQSERTLIAPTDVPKQSIIHGQLMENERLTQMLFDVSGEIQQLRDRRTALGARIEKLNKAKKK